MVKFQVQSFQTMLSVIIRNRDFSDPCIFKNHLSNYLGSVIIRNRDFSDPYVLNNHRNSYILLKASGSERY